MLEQILALIIPNLRLITAGLILLGVFLELVHIGQTRRINRKLSRAGTRLQQYLDVVFNSEDEKAKEEETDESRQAAQLEVPQARKSRQEENMRVSLEQKRQQKDGELLDTVLQEIFD